MSLLQHILGPRKDVHWGLKCFGFWGGFFFGGGEGGLFVFFSRKSSATGVQGNYFAPKILQIRYSAITIHQAVDTLIH